MDLAPVVKKVQVFSRDSHEYGCYLGGDGFKSIENCTSYSLVNRSSGFLGMRTLLYMGLFSCASLVISITVPIQRKE